MSDVLATLVLVSAVQHTSVKTHELNALPAHGQYLVSWILTYSTKIHRKQARINANQLMDRIKLCTYICQ